MDPNTSMADSNPVNDAQTLPEAVAMSSDASDPVARNPARGMDRTAAERRTREPAVRRTTAPRHDLDQHQNLQECADCSTRVPKQFLDDSGSCDICLLYYLDADLSERRCEAERTYGPGGDITDEEDRANSKEIRILFSQTVKLLVAVCRYLGRRR